MASAPPVPMQPPQGAPAPSAPAPQGGGGGVNPAFQIFAQISHLAQQMASALPDTSPMAEEIQNQVRMALQKAIQGAQQQQQAPPIG